MISNTDFFNLVEFDPATFKKPTLRIRGATQPPSQDLET